jgi:sugar phosphate isomerase/epimerase
MDISCDLRSLGLTAKAINHETFGKASSLKLGLIDNAWFDSRVGWVHGVGLASEIGFDTYDVFPVDLTPARKRGMYAAPLRSGMRVPTFVVFGCSLTDFNPEIRKYMVGWLKRQMELGRYFESRTMVLVLGEYIVEKVELKPDVRGDLPPGIDVVPLRDYLSALKGIGYDGPVSLELEWSPEPDRIIDWVTEAYEATDAMMCELGVGK